MENKVFCQSCAMPMEKPEDFGTNADGSKNGDYCQYCYQNGAFPDKDMTMAQMIEVCAPYTVEAGVYKTKEEAVAAMNAFFPTLKRWANA